MMVSILQLNPVAPHPDTGKPDITIWIAIRLILDHAESVDHAIALLEQYDIHGEGNYAHHLFISDSSGNAVVVEWRNNEMRVVKEQPVVTNFYLSLSKEQAFPMRDTTHCDRLFCYHHRMV